MHRLADWSWEEVKNGLEKDNRIILPLGAVEEHGRHLGLGTDFIEAEAIAEGASEAAGVLVAPTLAYGQSMEQMAFPGTVTLRPTTFIAVIEDLLQGLYHHGFRRVLVVNGHGGNTAALYNAVQMVVTACPELRVKYFAWWTDPEVSRLMTEHLGEQKGSHAADAETAFILAVRPAAVKRERLTGRDAPVTFSREIGTVQNFARLYPDGIMGLHPARATAEAGEAILRKAIEICARELADWPDIAAS
jgi:creatinine amidohydrolase